MLNYQLLRQQPFKSLISDNFNFNNNSEHNTMPSITTIKANENNEPVMNNSYYFNTLLQSNESLQNYSSNKQPTTSTPTFTNNQFSFISNTNTSTSNHQQQHQTSPFYIQTDQTFTQQQQPLPAVNYNNKDNRYFVPLYCGICRAYGCQCFYSSGGPPSTTSTPGAVNNFNNKTISGNEIVNTNNPVGSGSRTNGLNKNNSPNSLLIYSQQSIMTPLGKISNGDSNTNRTLLTQQVNNQLIPHQFNLQFDGNNNTQIDKNQYEQPTATFYNYINNNLASTTPPTLSNNNSALLNHLNNRAAYTAISSPILPTNNQQQQQQHPTNLPPPPYLFYQQANQLLSNNNSNMIINQDKRIDSNNGYFHHQNGTVYNGLSKPKLIQNNGLFNNNSITKPTHFSPVKSITTSSSSSSSLNNSNGTSFFSNPGLTTPLYLSNTSSSLSSSLSPPTSSSTSSSFFNQQHQYASNNYFPLNEQQKQAFIAVHNNNYMNKLQAKSIQNVTQQQQQQTAPLNLQLSANNFIQKQFYQNETNHHMQPTPILNQRPNGLKPQRISPNSQPNSNYSNLRKYYSQQQPTKYNKNRIETFSAVKTHQQPVIANKVRNKKFAAYESIMYKSTDSSSSSLSSTPLSFSPIPTQQEEHFSRFKKKQSSSFNSNPQVFNHVATNRFMTLCRHGLNCRFKRENKCKYYHPNSNESVVTATNGSSHNNFSNYHHSHHHHHYHHHSNGAKYRSSSTELKNIDISDYSIDLVEDNNINELIDRQSKLDDTEITNVTATSAASITSMNVPQRADFTEKMIKNDDDEIKLNWLTENMSIKLNYRKIEVNSDVNNMLNFDDDHFEDDDDDDDDEGSIELLLGTTSHNTLNSDAFSKLSAEIDFEKRKNRLLNSSSHSSLSSSLSSSSLGSSKTITYEAFDIISSANSATMVSTKLERTVLAE